ncbi:IPT/TIG domain-containing protein [Flavilitoribacter nigricans]|uniref:IPT/TIG domain-containing protein n=1 Tax=Flavilitoribacter nigricans (strain ATCC 23147 / DSM 23189 / NBRC 102662 / NCIMB 1420 / SS-2) TaxID=1122177 RepID=A0A2D0MY17_FLAN2|nr:IPT/TIG domain-containing protein [Flavilitoribacter nigricans]PHN01172.1 hypothetical protein CRP01_38505 [Flavilitoribacter nigricans DSM 23189 = NBRC 102662]
MSNIAMFKKTFWFLCLLVPVLIFQACEKDEEPTAAIDSNDVQLLSFGPSPLLRGDTLRIIGSSLDRVSAVVLSDNVTVQTFLEQSRTSIRLIIPTETVSGPIRIVADGTEVTSKASLTISEPISITDLSTGPLKAGEPLTISGTYLNLIQQVVFAKDVVVTDFVSQSQTELVVTVPAEARTGTIRISNGAAGDDLVVIESKAEVEIVLPTVSALTPAPIRPGDTLTVSGTDLDLATRVIFTGNAEVTEFYETSPAALKLVVPDNALEGSIQVEVASGVQVPSVPALDITAPTITDISPALIKAGNDITLSGTDLDLVTEVVFGGGQVGNIISKSETELVVTVPWEATEAVVTVNTVAETSSSASVLELIDPTISQVTPLAVKDNESITIYGTDLDLVSRVLFDGGLEGMIVSQTETELVVNLPLTAKSGVIVLETVNNAQVVSNAALEVTSSIQPLVLSMPSLAKVGEKIRLEGEKMDAAVQVIFAGDVAATRYGNKSESFIEVWVPEGAADGPLQLITEFEDVSISPDLNVVYLNELSELIYEDSRLGAWGDWGWGGASDWQNSEVVFAGANSAKKTYDGSWDAIRWGGASIDVSGYSELVFYVYGGEGTGGSTVQLVVNEGWGTPTGFDVVEGAWSEIVIPISAVNGGTAATTWTDILFQGKGVVGAIYIDHVGFK